MPKPNKEIKQLLINDFGYEPVELESYTGQLRALKETFNSLQIQNPKDARLRELAIAIKDLRAQREVEKDTTGKLKVTRKRRSDAKSPEQIKAEIDAKDKAIADRKAKKKKDAMNFISPGSTPPELPPAESAGGDMSSSLVKISNDVNIIKGIVEAQKNIEEDNIDDTRKAREKKKRSMAENLMEGGKEMYGKVAGAFGKVLKPAQGIFESIFKFIGLFLLGTALMKILDWFGNPANKDKIQSIFRFLKDFWPVIAAGVIALMGPIPTFVAAIALAFGFVPKIIDFVKSIFGLNKDVDKEIKKEEKDYEKNKKGTAFDDTTVTTTNMGPTPAGEVTKIVDGKEVTVTDMDESLKLQDEAREMLRMNKGGEVPGQGDKDTVPTMLTPGEFVLTKEAVNQIGADTLYNMNAAAGGVGKSNDVPRGPSGKPKKKKSTVQTMMDMGQLNPINNISKSMNNNTFNSMSSSSDATNNQSNVTNNITETTNMSGGGMTKNMSYMGGGGMTKNTSYMNSGGMTKNTSYMNSGGMTKNTSYMNSGGMVTNNVGGTSNVQYMKLGGMVKNFISNSPQARFLKFVGNQISKTPQARA